MVKLNAFRRSGAAERPAGTHPPPRDQYRIGFADLTIDQLWDPESEKYKVLCHMVHVTKATLQIGYIQLFISFVFSMFFAYHYMMAVSGNLSADHWINQYTARYISQLLLAVSLQLILVVVMIHGVRNERRSLLLPYIIYAAVAILAGCAQLGTDFIQLDHTGNTSEAARNHANTQFISHLFGTMIHLWCLSVVWRCYGYLGEKKIARQIGEQLSATQAAFHYPEQMLGYVMPQPPPYADTVISPLNPQHRDVERLHPIVNNPQRVAQVAPIVVEVPTLEQKEEEEKQPVENVV